MEKNSKKESLECNFYQYINFYVPILYSLKTRFLRRSSYGFIVWATEYLLPLMIAFGVVKAYYNIIPIVVSIIAVYNFYEIGYIQNDCETIKKELNPTLRLNYKYLEFYENHKTSIYIFRVFLGIIFSLFFIFHNISYFYIIILWLGIPFYMLYNVLRGRINLYLIFPLTIYRYCLPLFLSINYYTHDFKSTVCTLLISYPLIKFIEICAGGKSLPQEKWTLLLLKSFDNRFIFRVKYYLTLLFLFLIYYIISDLNIFIIIIPLYYFVIRLLQLNMPKLGNR